MQGTLQWKAQFPPCGSGKLTDFMHNNKIATQRNILVCARENSEGICDTKT